MKRLLITTLALGLILMTNGHCSNNEEQDKKTVHTACSNDELYLPKELWRLSLRYLPREDVKNARLVNKEFQEQANGVICEKGIRRNPNSNLIGFPDFLKKHLTKLIIENGYSKWMTQDNNSIDQLLALTALEFRSEAGRALTGFFDFEHENLTTLTSLRFHVASLQSQDVKSIPNLTHLKSLFIKVKTCQDYLTSDMSKLTNLTHLTINSGFTSFLDMSNHTYESSISHITPVSSIGSLTNLTTLDIGHDLWKQNDPRFLMNLTKLTNFTFNVMYFFINTHNDNEEWISGLANQINHMTSLKKVTLKKLDRLRPQEQTFIKDAFKPTFDRIANNQN